MFENIAVIPSFRNAVSSAVASGKLSHALIFEGSSDELRLACAKETAKTILCKSNNRPCGTCSACHKCDSGSHPDLHIIDSKGAMIKVDEIRNVKSKAKVYPNDGDKSVFIICESQNMNTQAQNALLKIFEEPAKHVSFILTCSSKSSLLDTITSRATSYFLGEEISQENSELSEKAMAFAKDLLLSLISENELSFLRKTATFQKDKQLFSAVLKSMQPIIRDALVISSAGKTIISGETDIINRLRSTLTQKKLMQMLSEIQALREYVDSSANHNLAITRLSSILYTIK
jgi:DNA polymerase III gamma/tau subunit